MLIYWKVVCPMKHPTVSHISARYFQISKRIGQTMGTLEIFGACPGWPQRQLYNHKIWVWKLRLCGYFDVIIQFEIKNPEI